MKNKRDDLGQIIDELIPPKLVLVNRLPRKKDTGTIYVKEVKDYYKTYTWTGKEWFSLDKIKCEELKNDI